MRTTALWTACLLAAIGNAAAAQQSNRTPAPTPGHDEPAPSRQPLALSPSAADRPEPGLGNPSPIPGLTDKLGLDAPPAPSPAPVKAPSALLGEPFESQTAGLVFRPPLGSKPVRQSDPDHVIDYVDDDRKWLLKVTRARLAQPMPLQTVKTGNGGRDRIGLLDYTVQDILKDHPAAQVLRQEIVNVGENNVGIAVLRLNVGSQRYLRQQAIFQATEQGAEQLYYVFNLTTPAARDGTPEQNPEERLAAETFKGMLDTIQILDRRWIRQDQVNRLFRTRALFTDWNDKGGKRIKDAVVPETWLRIIRGGKDIGYSYVAEEFIEGKDVKGNPGRAFDGVLVSVRSRTIDGGNQADVGSQMFVSLDRKHEDWATVANVVQNKGQRNENKQQTSELGFSELRTSHKVDRTAARDPNDTKAPPTRDVESYTLSITRPKRDRDTMAKPEYHTPSPWYIPQAVGAMLPRLLPLNNAHTYLFQSYVSEQGEVVHRYVDVGFEKEVNLGGQTVHAIPISDRVRLEGTPTVHYMSPDGKYLGSINEEAKIVILPTDKATLEKLWKSVDATKPDPAAEAKENAPKAEAPKADAPKPFELPKVDAPKPQSPTTPALPKLPDLKLDPDETPNRR